MERVRSFLGVASLTVLTGRDMPVSFRASTGAMSEAGISKANAMVQIATNRAVSTAAPKFDKRRFEDAIDFALTQTTNHEVFYPLIKDRFLEAGVVLVVLPNLSGSKTNGATKRIGKSVMLMVNDRRLYADSFWFTLLHEVGHVINGDYGISFESDAGDAEQKADEYAANKLIDPQLYEDYVHRSKGHFTATSITAFAKSIDRDPGIVLGRLDALAGGLKKARTKECLMSPTGKHVWEDTGRTRPGEVWGNVWPDKEIRCIHCGKPDWRV